MFVSTFSAVYEVDENNNPYPLKKEGSLYLLERSVQPTVKLFLLNRAELDDFEDWITDKTEFSERDSFLSYLAQATNGR